MPTTMNEMQNSIRELGAQIRESAQRLAQDANNPAVPVEEIDRQQHALRAQNARLAALRESYAAQFEQDAQHVTPAAPQLRPDAKASLREMLASNEYARAFAHALRTGARPQRGLTDERIKPLFDALTIAGGEPTGSDGGFLVPEDIDRTIREKRRTLSPLADLFTEETTSTNSGWRVVDTAPTKGFTKLESEIPAGKIAQDDQPKFAKVSYKLDTYGLILPISNELASDEVANLFGYLSNWFAKKMVLTENLLLKTLMEQLEATDIAQDADPIAAIKRTLNRELDPAVSVLSSIVTNQNGFDLLDQMLDKNGRPMLAPDPTNATVMRFKGRTVYMLSNDILPEETEKHPLYIGDFKEYASLFRRQNLEVTSTDVGGNAFATNSIEVRGIARLGACVFDDKAAVHKTLSDPAAE